MTRPPHKIKISTPQDINWENLAAIAYDNAWLEIDDALLSKVDAGRRRFLTLINQGVACYGVTTGLGQLVTQQLTVAQQQALPANLLRARSAAIGAPLSKPVARAIMVLRLVNFLSARDGVTAQLCRYLVDRLNDGFTPWIPSLGHGMASDAIANTHAFQTFIGEGFVYDPDSCGQKQPAAAALAKLNVNVCALVDKEGLALISGVTAAPACAFDAHRQLSELLSLATLVAATSMEGLAAPKDAVSAVLLAVSSQPGLKPVIDDLQRHLAHSRIAPFNLQAPVSYRVIPQVHGACWSALKELRNCIESCFLDFSGNPLLVADDSPAGGKLFSVGLFHNQQLLNQLEHVAIALAHVGCLSERRLHRLLDAKCSGLNAQLAARPGFDAGLVVTQKACIDLAARLRMLAQPVSLFTSESSGGQEDYMALAMPAIARLAEMESLVKGILAYELLGALTALSLRGLQAGDGVVAAQVYFHDLTKSPGNDRSPGPDVEVILEAFATPAFRQLLAC